MMVATIDTTIARVTNSSDDSDIVRMTSSIGIVHREAIGNLANGVGIGISLTLAIVAMVDSSIASIASVVATVTNSSISRDEASDDPTAIAIGCLPYGQPDQLCRHQS